MKYRANTEITIEIIELIPKGIQRKRTSGSKGIQVSVIVLRKGQITENCLNVL